MTSKSSRFIPYAVLMILIATISAEGYFGIDIDLETYIPLLLPMGIGGAALSAVKSAAEARKKIPKGIEDLIKQQAKDLRTDQNPP